MRVGQLTHAERWLLARLLARLGLAAVFLYAALPKLMDPASFAADLANYRLLPEAMVAPLAVGLPLLELLAALGLVAGPYVQGGALLVGLMLVAFAAAMTQARLRGIDLDCGCFGSAERSRVSWGGVLSNLGLAVLAFWVAYSSRRSRNSA